MKRIYEAPTLEAKEYAQLENVFTYCDKAVQHGCTDVTGSGNDSDKVGNPSDSNAHKSTGGGSDNPGGDIDPS